ncbi:MAG: serine/threonine protein kinase, partial [Planctomycetales bacterium]|nr:serine/threonine protein kinase [Planctomycetales bacterium]
MAFQFELSTGQQRVIDTICDAFESAWAEVVKGKGRDSERPQLGHYLSQAERELAEPLLRELLAIERTYHYGHGPSDAIDSAIYVAMFPEFKHVIEDALGSAAQGRSASETPPPTTIGRYTIEKEIGRGAFATVYRAVDTTLHRSVAIKVPRPDKRPRAERLAAYLDEARLLAGMQHPAIVPVYDVVEDENAGHYIVTRLIEGTTLAKEITQQRLEWREAIQIIQRVAEALHHAHGCGLVHRDVKPANILLDERGLAFLTDFGMALKDEDYGRQGRQGGTIAYMSPEQARGEGHLIDGRSDIFSLGATLYEAVTGSRPFRGDTPSEIFDRILNHDVRPPRMVR